MPELSRPVPLYAIGEAGRTERIVATAAERDALAARFGILGIDRLEATLRLTTEVDGSVLVRGGLDAAVTQQCVVTFEPVAQRVAEPVRWRLLPPGREAADGPDEPDDIETAGVADLGEALAEQLSLALDPYPRAPDAALPGAAAAAASGAFAALAKLRPRG